MIAFKLMFNDYKKILNLKLYSKEQEIDKTLMAYLKIIDEVKMEKAVEENGKSNEFEILRNKTWNTVDNSFGINSSLIAKVYDILLDYYTNLWKNYFCVDSIFFNKII